MSSGDADDPWAPTPVSQPPQPGTDTDEVSPADIQAKEQLVKSITSKQEGLRALLQRVNQVQGEANKLKSGNETLQTYIDNLTRNNAMAAAAGR
ncbi:hypothetical protein RHOSPDRAFT_32814 [Rhodotorula sp. JG-1b]|nr:hypothetical protein RHOSPDRAFT_32814 [Rhodotorula sp. JG-1b]